MPPVKLSIVIPIFNELKNIEPLYKQLTDVLVDMQIAYEIVFSDDGSRDGSNDALDHLAANDKRVKIVHLRRNFGQTAALMAGFNHSGGDIIISMDGDMQNDPKDIPALYAEIEKGPDVVSGWRIERKEGLIRRLPSRIANAMISKITGVKIHDYGCTLKAYRREVLQDVYLYGEMHRFVPALAAWQGGTVSELPVRHHARIHGTSKYGLDRTSRVILDLLVVRFLGRGIDRPIQVFGKAGIYCVLFSVLTGIWAVYLKLFQGVSFIQTPLPVLVALLVLVALIFFMMGLMAEMLTRIYFESQKKYPYAIRTTRNIDSGDDTTLSVVDRAA